MNRKILFLQPIFVPNEVGLKVQLDSISSLLAYCRHFEFSDLDNITFCFGGYCYSEESWHKVIDIVFGMMNQFNFKLHLDKLDKNYGKAYVVNKMYKKYHSGEEYIFTMDSDIMFDLSDPGSHSLFHRLFNLSKEIEKIKPEGKRFGLLSLSQKEMDCQLHYEYNNNLDIGSNNLSWASHGGGIAGGCLFISCDAWDKVGGYRQGDVYDGDDGFLMADMHESNFFAAVVNTISIIHPKGEIKTGYQKWKGDKLKVACGKRLDAKELEKSIKDASEFWDD